MLKKKDPKRWVRLASVVFGLWLGLTTSLALAVNPDSTTLPNGAELSVQIDNPTNNEENGVPVNADGSGGGTIDVAIDGEASVGQGVPDIHITFVIDVSGSTGVADSCGGGLGDILDCEKLAVNNVINDPNFASVLDVGVSVFADTGEFADMSGVAGQQALTTNSVDAQTVVNSTFSVAGGDGGVGQFTNKVAGNLTNMTAGLQAADNSVAASGAGTKRVVFLSDGVPNPAGPLASFDAAVTALGVRIDSFAIGQGSACGNQGDVSLERMAFLSDGTCTPVPNPANLPGLLPDLIATFLDSVQVKVNGGDIATNTNPVIPPSADGPVTATYDATANLGVGTFLITATAEGSDNAGSDTVTADITKQVLQLIASPFIASNELSEDNAHSVNGQILGGTGPDRDIDFVVGGQNAGTATPQNGSLPATPGGNAVSFNYTVPGNECDSLGTDTIMVGTTIAGQLQSIDLSKEWVDTIAPEAQCAENGNPHGNKPHAPGKGGQGQNQDGFYELLATDNLSGASCAPLELFLTDNGSGTVFGPFEVGTVIKYTQAPGAPPKQKEMGSDNGQAGNVDHHVFGNGDAVLTATDQSGNTSEPVSCLVPPPPK
jgi:hypothetical protein